MDQEIDERFRALEKRIESLEKRYKCSCPDWFKDTDSKYIFHEGAGWHCPVHGEIRIG